MSNTARVGAVMLAALIVLAFFILRIEKLALFDRGSRPTVRVSFASVAGLDAKSPVRIAGVRAGFVESIALDGSRAIVTLSLDGGTVVHEGARAAVRSLGLLGEQYVELDPGPAGNPALKPGTLLAGSSPQSFDQLLQTAGDVGGDIKEVTSSLRRSIGGPEGERRIIEILENVRDLAAAIKGMVEENRSEVGATISNFRDFSQTLKSELPRLADKLYAMADRLDGVVNDNRGNVTQTLENLRELSARLKTSADSLNGILGKMDRGEGSIGKLLNDTQTVDNLNSTLKAVEGGVGTLRNTIGRAERWELDLNLRSEALPRIDKSRTTFGIDLATSPRRFYRVELVDSPQGKDHLTTEVVTKTFPDGHKEVTTTEKSESTDNYNINAQVGWRLFPSTTLRAGLFESHGGVAVDQTFWKNRIRLTAEVYHWGREVKPPHVRLEGRWYVTKNLFAVGGWDDPTYSRYQSFFLGAGVRWSDDDMKYLLGSFGSLAR